MIGFAEAVSLWGNDKAINNTNYLSIGCGYEKESTNEGISTLKQINIKKRNNILIFTNFVIFITEAYAIIQKEIYNIIENNSDSIDILIENFDIAESEKDELKQKLHDKSTMTKIREEINGYGTFATSVKYGLMGVDYVNNLGINIIKYPFSSLYGYVDDTKLGKIAFDATNSYVLSPYILGSIPITYFTAIQKCLLGTKFCIIMYQITTYINVLKIIFDGYYKGIKYMLQKFEELYTYYYEKVKFGNNEYGNLFIVIKILYKNIRKISAVPDFSEQYQNMYLSNISPQTFMKNALTNPISIKVKEITELVNKIIIHAGVGSDNMHNMAENILGQNYERLSVVFSHDHEMDETDPIKLRLMLIDGKKYIEDSNDKISSIRENIKNAINKKEIFIKDYKNNIIIDAQYIIGRNIAKYIHMEKMRLIKKYYVNDYPFISKADNELLENTIEQVYIKYYEAKYMLIQELMNYDNNDILDDNINLNREIQLSYIYKNTNKNVIDNLKNIFFLLDINKSDDNITDNKKYYDDLILYLVSKRDDAGQRCNYCYMKIVGTNGKHMCGNLINSIDTNAAPSNTNMFWNTCKSIQPKYDANGMNKSELLFTNPIFKHVITEIYDITKYTHKYDLKPDTKLFLNIKGDICTIIANDLDINYTPEVKLDCTFILCDENGCNIVKTIPYNNNLNNMLPEVGNIVLENISTDIHIKDLRKKSMCMIINYLLEQNLRVDISNNDLIVNNTKNVMSVILKINRKNEIMAEKRLLLEPRGTIDYYKLLCYLILSSYRINIRLCTNFTNNIYDPPVAIMNHIQTTTFHEYELYDLIKTEKFYFINKNSIFNSIIIIDLKMNNDYNYLLKSNNLDQLKYVIRITHQLSTDKHYDIPVEDIKIKNNNIQIYINLGNANDNNSHMNSIINYKLFYVEIIVYDINNIDGVSVYNSMTNSEIVFYIVDAPNI